MNCSQTGPWTKNEKPRLYGNSNSKSLRKLWTSARTGTLPERTRSTAHISKNDGATWTMRPAVGPTMMGTASFSAFIISTPRKVPRCMRSSTSWSSQGSLDSKDTGKTPNPSYRPSELTTRRTRGEGNKEVLVTMKTVGALRRTYFILYQSPVRRRNASHGTTDDGDKTKRPMKSCWDRMEGSLR